MKKLFLALIALNSTLALADSDMLLERTESPYRSREGRFTTVTLHEGGQITKTTCVRPGTCEEKNLGNISAEEEREVRDLIAEARKGKKKSGPPSFCLAVPSVAVVHSADEGRLTLSESTAPCGSHVFNDSDAAKTLVRKLDEYAAR